MDRKLYTVLTVLNGLVDIVQKMADDLEYQNIAKEAYTMQLQQLQTTLEELRAS
ncbi:hypothetical protein MYX82_08940 [Acidobacteria bacterium AH-259-D05]|nr:hypothetical protein [Acidobacteria bacterium AH-259-D05]